MKYGTWNVSGYRPGDVEALRQAGVSPLAACVLCSRGYDAPDRALAFLSPDEALHDPMLLCGMGDAASRVKRALSCGEHIAVFGDYDVDGITSTCLLTDFLRSAGANCTSYIPGRLEEGYGLNEPAIRALKEQGVQLIITVDCGITAVEEAALCRSLGVDLVVTDHHECKAELPAACAVVDPRQGACAYPNPALAGVGVAFKLAAAICGDQDAMLARYADLVCMGTVADVMPLLGENRAFVRAGLAALQSPARPGVRALMDECGCAGKPITAGTIGYMLAPRINAAGRLGQVDLALELFLTDDEARARQLAAQLCELNRERQLIEADIYADAKSRLQNIEDPKAIVMASETWHQGVVGIVASRLAEDYLCPVFLICMDGDHGKASSRSYGGFHLFSSLAALAPLLENYGGHDLAAGFTIRRENIDAFREQITKLAADFCQSGEQSAALEIDCAVPPEYLTLANVQRLDDLEPCGASWPRPVFYLDELRVEQLTEVGAGRHLKLRLRRGNHVFGAIFFSMTAVRSAICEGDTVEVAFTPQINEYRGTRSVQLNLIDIRPCSRTREQLHTESALYRRLSSHEALSAPEAAALTPSREEFVAVWKYLSANADCGSLSEDASCLSRKISRLCGLPASPMRTRVCLDVFCERGLIDLHARRQELHIRLTGGGKKVDLNSSSIMIHLKEISGGD